MTWTENALPSEFLRRYRDAVNSSHLGKLYRPKILTSVCKHKTKQGSETQKSVQAVLKFIHARQKYALKLTGGKICCVL